MSHTRIHARSLRTGLLSSFALGLACLVASSTTASAQGPTGLSYDDVGRIDIPALDLRALAAEDISRESQGMAPRYAVPHAVTILPDLDGTWDVLDADTLLWRLRVSSFGALSINLGFEEYNLPEGASLVLHATGRPENFRLFTAEDNEEHGELWTPVVLGDDILVELTLPADKFDAYRLVLSSINVGYRFFGEKRGSGARAGSCNIDVVCPLGDAWWDEIQSVGVLSESGWAFCTGFMVNNTAQDQTPYLMTADHCGVTSSSDASLVVYWNFYSPTCGLLSGGSLNDYQTGSTWRADYYDSDFTLVELDDDPDPAHEVSFSGWDWTGNNATTAIAIHHPNTDEKCISFEYQPTSVTSYGSNSVPGDGTHVRVTDWDQGTTEPGSSGSPLYNQNHQVIGQLHGGGAACGNDESDWYGGFAVSWTGGGSNNSRLSNWLDPTGSGVTTLDTLNPYGSGLKVSPGGTYYIEGDLGGPFTPASKDYTLTNQNTTPIGYDVTTNVNWLTVTNGTGTISGGGSVLVTVSVNANANSLNLGLHSGETSFVNTTDGSGDTARGVEIKVGTPQVLHSELLTTDPGWTTTGQWAYGQPTGGGGAYGNSDPTSGHTGPNVYGYNLNGDYANNLSQLHLTSGAFDCSGSLLTTLKFWRYLNVETSDYDHAYVKVSPNGSTWTTVWENGGEITDGSWNQQEIDISAIADGQSTVYLRWTMGSTDGSWTYSGWNIDDIEIWGLTGGGPGTMYCSGENGAGTPCPCGNDADGSLPGAGCANGFFASGARLTGSGTASVSNDTLVLQSVAMEPNNFCRYIQADNDLTPGLVWGDGLQCAGGNLKRLGVFFTGGSGAANTSGSPFSISAMAGNVSAGVTKYYQCWYRTPNGSPCLAGFNASNGYAVTWQP